MEAYVGPLRNSPINRIKRAMINQRKAEGCSQCGFTNPRALLFHHPNPSQKSFGISTYQKHGAPALAQELSKCDVLCGNCHMILHF